MSDFGDGMEIMSFNLIVKNQMDDLGEANVLHCGKMKLCRILHSFGMFTLMT